MGVGVGMGGGGGKVVILCVTCHIGKICIVFPIKCSRILCKRNVHYTTLVYTRTKTLDMECNEI